MLSVCFECSQMSHGTLLAICSKRIMFSTCAKLCDNTSEVKPLPQAKYFPVKSTPMLPSGTFNGKVALVSGGGTGLGKAMSLMISSLGADVCIIGRRQHVLESTAAEISSSTSGRILPVSADIRDPGAITSAVDQCVDQLGLPHIVINNAAGNFISPTERLSVNGWKTIVDIVLNGTALLTMDIGKRMIASSQGGVFLNITTTYTRTGSGFVSPSAAAKSGVETLTKGLAAEWGRYGIRVNCIAPGPIHTEGAFSRLDPSGEFRQLAVKSTPAGRFGEKEEIANLAAYLVSDYSSWISGESIALDGGGLPFRSGEFNQLCRVSGEQWDLLEKLIRAGNKADKH